MIIRLRPNQMLFAICILGHSNLPKNRVLGNELPPITRIITCVEESRLADHRDRASGGKADVRSKAAEEQPATRRLGPTMTQVGNDGCTDISRHRDPCPLPTLCANEHLAGSPIDIVEGEGRDL